MSDEALANAECGVRNEGTQSLWLPVLTRIGFAHKSGNVEDVVDAGEDGEGGHGCVNRGQVKASKVWADGGNKDEYDAGDLDKGARFAEPRWFEAAKAGHHIYRSGDRDNADIASDDGCRNPKRNREVTPVPEHARYRKHDERGSHQ